MLNPIIHILRNKDVKQAVHKILSTPLSMGLSQEEMREWVAISSSRGIFLTKGLNSRLFH